METRFNKLFTKIRNDGSVYKLSIVSWGKEPRTYETIDISDRPDKAEFINVVKSFDCILIINLWLVEFEFRWIKNL